MDVRLTLFRDLLAPLRPGRLFTEDTTVPTASWGNERSFWLDRERPSPAARLLAGLRSGLGGIRRRLVDARR